MGELIDAAFVARAFDIYADHHNNCAGHGLNDQCSCGLLDARRTILAAPTPPAPDMAGSAVIAAAQWYDAQLTALEAAIKGRSRVTWSENNADKALATLRKHVAALNAQQGDKS